MRFEPSFTSEVSLLGVELLLPDQDVDTKHDAAAKAAAAEASVEEAAK
jgi:hypothetical protein